MKLFSFLKQIIQTPILKSAKVAETSKETIEFPDTYKSVGAFIKIALRPDNAISGSEFGNSIINVLATQQRDELVYYQCQFGNIPNWMRDFKSITVSDDVNTLTYYVSPDVLCVGNDTDFLRVSLNGYTAKKVVDLLGCMLPTKKISDQIWQNSDLKLMPVAMGASFHMSSTKTLIDHNNIIEKQRNDRNFNIITGHKKDIVYTKHLLVDRSRLAIYGWHYPSGKPIQGPNPNSTSHSVSYQDYSSSVRLISQTAILNERPVNLYDVLNNKNYAYLISDEGPMDARSMYLGY